MTSMPNFWVSSGAYATQNQYGEANYGKIKSNTSGAVIATHSAAVGNLGLGQKFAGNAQGGGDQSLDLFTIDPARLSGAQAQQGVVAGGHLMMNSNLVGSTTPSVASLAGSQSARLHGSGAFQGTTLFSAEAG